VRIRRVNHLGILVEDLDEAVRSFTENLGLSLDHVER
jgi:catechol 2,3-dioxygenase-like lactoylglutathione lyase family enzyme